MRHSNLKTICIFTNNPSTSLTERAFIYLFLNKVNPFILSVLLLELSPVKSCILGKYVCLL